MLKNTKYVSMDLRNGEMCYCCKDKIDIDKNALLNNILNNKTNYRICKACQRDEKLDEIVNHSKLSKINKFITILLEILAFFNNEYLFSLILFLIDFHLFVNFLLKSFIFSQ